MTKEQAQELYEAMSDAAKTFAIAHVLGALCSNQDVVQVAIDVHDKAGKHLLEVFKQYTGHEAER